MKSTLLRYSILRASGICLLLVIWYLAVAWSSNGIGVLPYPTSVITRVFELFGSSSFWADFSATTRRWIGGYVLGIAVGVPLGLVMGASRAAYLAFEFPVEFLRALPVTSIFPLFLLIWGIGDASKIAMVFMATVFVVALNSAYGVINAPSERRKMAKVFGASRWQTFSKIVIFDAAPQISVGLRTTLSVSLIVVIVSEMFIGTAHGLGQRVYFSYQTNDVLALYANVVILGLLGYVINLAYASLERRLLFWSGR